jgi:alginate O-acetyltransferase complex protein AlgI
MTVLSVIWLAALVLTPAVYWLAPERLRSAILTGATLTLIILASPATGAVLIAAVLIAWAYRSRFAGSGAAAALACVAQLAPLIMWRIGAQWPLPFVSEIVIPLGLAFIALRGVHYVIEVYRGGLPEHRLSDVVDYFFFLPTIIAGPVHRFPHFLMDSRRRRWNGEMFSDGLQRILYGYVKITVLANLIVSTFLLAAISTHTTAGEPLNLYLTMFAKGLNGYLQFAGYSDVAIGFALLLGFRVMENFNAPLIKPNVQQFWASWHMSLTSWCRDYVYTPTFSISRARWLGILSSMAVLGLWHEFTARYLAWGLYNGAGIVLWHRWRRLAGERVDAQLSGTLTLKRLWYGTSVLLTVHFIFIGFVLVQQDSLPTAFAYLGSMFGLR